jgi:uncharacterized protein
MSSQVNHQQQIVSLREKFITSANKGKILANRCSNCGHIMLGTIYYCEKCHDSQLEPVELEGIGKIVTYTIQAVAPEGFSDIGGSYAWIVFKIDNTALKVSGILLGVKSPADLPLGSKVKVDGFDTKYGLRVKKLS